MIRTKRLYEFITEIVSIRNEEMEEKAIWEFWLHKDFERTYNDCRESMISSQTKEVSEEELTDIVMKSREIAQFVPPNEM